MTSNENWPPNVLKQLAKELKGFEESPLEDIKLSVDGDNFSNIHADMEGPSGTPYEGGTFRIKLVLSQGFPQVPPKGYFLTKIFHPNISKNGEICVNTLKKDWKPTLGLRHVLLTIRCLLIEPFPESALNEEAGKMLMEDYETYDKYARLMTSIHAMTTRSKMKPQTTESTTVNIVSMNSDLISTVAVKQTNRDNGDSGISPTASDIMRGSLSPCSKKPRIENESKTTHTPKKKPEQLRKRTLKRL